MVKFVYFRNKHRVQSLNQCWILNRLEEFAQCCVAAGSMYPNIIGFIDGTARAICRPKYKQRDFYSGYKKQHMLKYQSIVFPNGLIGRLDGPFIGRRHDAAILNLSDIRLEMANVFSTPTTNYALYGDPGYSNSQYIKVGYKNHHSLTERQKLFNKTMSALRVSVEYGFGKIVQLFAFVDFKKNQKVYLQHLKFQYYVAAFFSKLLYLHEWMSNLRLFCLFTT
ncbi:hypothetical protein PPYR_11359 [Photinus pyralis]|uniref:DDE Tnp4 domain-containing protein n=1 Tax=Photinus pyralis TaxID=7054 RepID=A0A5N4AB13_PHOPY|nr:hypothetical protein PPYR_11359 [Photinus pyralis]